jgi:hypothetical protein
MYVFKWFAGSIPSRSRATQNTSVAATRQTSLDRDVFYFDNDRREEVVTYKPFVLGSSVKKFGLSEEEQSVYKSSLANLCSQLAKVSKTSVNGDQNKKSESRLSLEKV